MNGFKDRLQVAVAALDGKSLRQISLESGLSENNLANILNSKDLENSRSGPGFFAITRLCETLNITPNYLAGIGTIAIGTANSRLNQSASELAGIISDLIKEADGRPTDATLFSMYLKGGGRLEAFESVMDYCDLLEAPSMGNPLNLVHVAPKGMTALTVGSSDANVVNLAVQTTVDKDFRDNMLKSHMKAERDGYLVSLEEIDIRSTSLAKRIRASYIRHLFQLENASGHKFILVHSRPV